MDAILIDNKTIQVLIPNSFYDGISSLFRIRKESGKSQLLEIEKTIKHQENTEYRLKTEKLSIGQEYYISDEHNMTTILKYDGIIRTKEFDNEFYYDGDDLGAIYSKEKTVFKVWSPLAKEIVIKINNKFDNMVLLDKGVWQYTAYGDLDGAIYTYLVNICGKWSETIDPYAYSSTPNGGNSVVINLEKCEIDLKKECLNPLNQNVDAIIYELHIRDFSVASNLKNKGKYIAFKEPHALDKIVKLGVTHVQLLPFYDFGSVDELNQFDYYNWGYDPMQYNVPEGSYASDVNDPYSRINDCKKMIQALHENGLRVNMDVVYNHMFDKNITSFHKLMPGYYFRYGKKGEVSNGSFCGNDIESTRLMCRKYIIDSAKRWFSFYGIDGMRFDLMGIIDYITMNKVYEECSKIEPNLMIYGEGWNMPTLLDDELKTTQINNAKTPHIGFFNDRFRDAIKGATQQEDIKKIGYATGDKSNVKIIMELIQGTCLPSRYGYSYLSANQVINYVECHDNATVWDKMLISNKNESEQTRIKRARLMLAMILLSQGVPFIHAGEEFMRTKMGVHNSYLSSDEVNKLDYDLYEKNIDSVNYVSDLINIRKEHSLFRLSNQEDIMEKTIVKQLQDEIIAYTLKDKEELLVLINPNNKTYAFDMNDDFIVIFNQNGMVKDNTIAKKIIVEELSVTILKKI